MGATMLDEDLVLVTGVPRSGTSLITGLLVQAAEVWAGTTVEGNAWNPDGYFEHREIRQGVTKPLLKEHGFDPAGQDPLPPPFWIPDAWVKTERIERWRRRIEGIIEQDGYDEGPLVIKDCKLALTWKAWDAAFPGATWIIVRRDPKEIANSCLKTKFMRSRNSLAGWLEWIAGYAGRLNHIAWNVNRSFEVDGGATIRGELEELTELATGPLDLEWDERAALNLVR